LSCIVRISRVHGLERRSDGNKVEFNGGRWKVVVFVVSINITDEKENVLADIVSDNSRGLTTIWIDILRHQFIGSRVERPNGRLYHGIGYSRRWDRRRVGRRLLDICKPNGVGRSETNNTSSGWSDRGSYKKWWRESCVGGHDIEGTASRRRRSEADMEVLLRSKCIDARNRVGAIRVFHVADGLFVLRIADLYTSRHLHRWYGRWLPTFRSQNLGWCPCHYHAW